MESITLGYGQVNLLWFLPYVLFRVVFCAKSFDIIYLCDALLSPVGVVAKMFSRSKVVVTVHGLDITYSGFCYQKVIPKCVAALDKVVCVSRMTMEECAKRGVQREKCLVIPNGVDADVLVRGTIENVPEDLRHVVDATFGKKIIITVGRLVKRKGVEWFIGEVMSDIPDDYVYFVIGSGPERNNIQSAVERKGLERRVFLLGQVSERTLEWIYAHADVMVMPNRKIAGDPEGFGIVAISAAVRGLPVVASNIDGLPDAVINGRTGWLVDPDERRSFVDKIVNPGLDRRTVADSSRVFFWEHVILNYQQMIGGAI
ncbi:MAG TPA: glycosyltransferase family 4 protein [Candidatus Omnitrophota bacterium]|nr:glycosyltransferase family 4 protein [Candidatus Omnitrophota bacterium]